MKRNEWKYNGNTMEIYRNSIVFQCISTVFLLYFIFSFNCLFAQSLTLEQCLEVALRENPQIKIAEQKLISAGAKKSEAFAGFLPNISGSLSYIRRKEVEDSSSVSGLTSVSPAFRFSLADEMYDTKLSLTQPVFMWGKIYQSHRQASLGYKISEEEYKRVKSEIVYRTKEAFYKFVLAKQTVVISKEAYDVADRHFRVTEKLYKEGRMSTYDVSRAKVSLANVKTNLIHAENGLNLAKQSLFNVMNIDEKNVDFTGEMEYIKKEYNMDSLIKEALTERPEIRQIDLQDKISTSLVKLASANNKPNIVVTGYTEWQNTIWDTKDWYYTWTTMAILNVPIFDGFATGYKVKQAKSGVEQVKLSKILLEESIKFEVRAVYLSYKQSRESIEANQENVDAARSNLQTAQKRYELGLVSDIEVRDAQLSLTQAETNYIQALFEYNLSLASIEKAVGR